MGDFHKGNISFERTYALLHSLYEYGVRHVVISPGSRSAPLTLAAAYHQGLKKHVIIDERSAAFFALGMGKSTGVPAVLICTSGTAVANYFPAVIEAAKSSTPLIVLTADRPPRDRMSGAPQTINQIKIFGDYPLFFQDAPEPFPTPENRAIFAHIAEKLWHISSTGAGPVHLNLPFDKPLEPENDFIEPVIHSMEFNPVKSDIMGENSIETVAQPASSESGIPAGTENHNTRNDGIRSPLAVIRESKRPLLILGPSNRDHESLGEAIHNFAKAGFPVLRCAGAPAILHGIAGYDAFLRQIHNIPGLKPDLIIRTGLHPASKGLEVFFEACSDTEHLHFSGTDDFNDALRTVSRKVPVEQLAVISRQVGNIDPEWLKFWMHQQNSFLDRRTSLLSNTGVLTDGHVFNSLTGLIPDNWLTILSNSFPVRDYDLFRSTASMNKTITNRGASGIDGVISTASGACLAAGHDGVLFIGDIAALHDSNALVLSNQLKEQTLIVVIINNGGGNIFRMLPINGHKQIYEHYFETPQNVKFQSLADAYGIKYTKVTSADDLLNAWSELTSIPGLHIMECVTNADESMRIRRELWDF
ncbi:MAG: 2-succinyl-5-enolpyruvyl-6-hydroxy-3-cyclohexene-1-carboxylic-acid synthase [Balneolaceae bacterium]|nr:MAG: 2-succinyl-5-enolpyruvyl-6-hydroxy-3-cyclohexene-1-carboxylic-acid synthase [Balneolaceae bacterium]